MKKFTIALFVSGIICQVFPQSAEPIISGHLTDSIVKTKSFVEFGKHINQKETFSYNLFNDVKDYEVYINLGSFYENVDWKKIEKKEYTYDEQGVLLNMIRQKRALNEEDWTIDYKLELTFEGNDSIQTFYDWSEDTWQQKARWVYTRDTENLTYLSLWQTWDLGTNDWNNILRFDTIYTSNGMLDTLRYFIWFLPDEQDTGYIEAFDYTYYPDTVISYLTENNTNYTIKRYHDTGLNAKIKIQYKQVGNTFVPLFKNVSSLDDNQNITISDSYLWNIGEQQWDLSGRNEYIYYDDGDHLLKEKVKYLPGSTITVSERYIYTYYSDLMLKSQKVFMYPIHQDLYEYYEYYYSLRYVGVPEATEHGQTKIFPNPAQDFLFVNNSKSTFHNCLVHDLNGRLVKNEKLGAEHSIIDITDLPVGSYVITLIGSTTSHTQQIIKIK